MSSSNKGRNVDPRLQSLTNALYLDANDDVVVRTSIDGDVIITGTVNVPGQVTVQSSPDAPVHVHVTEIPEVEIKNDSGNAIPVSKNNSTNSASNRIYISQETDITVADSTYEMNVARGLIPGQYVEMKNGYCATMAAGGATIWSQSTPYPWSSWTTAQQLYIISTSASDAGQGCYIEGLDASYNKISEVVTTNGTTAVATTQNFLRINRAYLVSGNVNVGSITQRLTSGTGTVVGGMYPSFSRNKQGVFTVPNGYTAYILYGDVSSYKNGQGQVDGQVVMKVRTNVNTPFMNVFAGIAANGQYRNEFNVPLAVPQHSDIDVQFYSSGTCTVTCNWEMILIPNT